jgi:basic membrane protein A
MDNGADIVTITTDSAAATQTAAKRGLYSIGNDSDMTLYGPEAHLTANIFNWGIYYEHIYNQVKNGTWKPSSDWWGIETGAVDLAPFGKMVPKNVQDMVMAKKAEIASGEFVVFKGPIKGQDGSTAIAAGAVPSDQDLLSMMYYVEGVVGDIPQ